MNDGLVTIGGVEEVALPRLGLKRVHARVDTGARTSAIWATDIREENNRLLFTLFGQESSLYDGQLVEARRYRKIVVASSNGVPQERYVVKLLLEIGGKRLNASFSLADRSAQVYPVLIGRRVLSGRFIVNVKNGKRLTAEERQRSEELQARLGED